VRRFTPPRRITTDPNIGNNRSRNGGGDVGVPRLSDACSSAPGSGTLPAYNGQVKASGPLAHEVLEIPPHLVQRVAVLASSLTMCFALAAMTQQNRISTDPHNWPS